MVKSEFWKQNCPSKNKVWMVKVEIWAFENRKFNLNSKRPECKETAAHSLIDVKTKINEQLVSYHVSTFVLDGMFFSSFEQQDQHETTASLFFRWWTKDFWETSGTFTFYKTFLVTHIKVGQTKSLWTQHVSRDETLIINASEDGRYIRTNGECPERTNSSKTHIRNFFVPFLRLAAQLLQWFGKCLQMSPVRAERHHVSSPTWNVSGLESRAEKRVAYFPCQLTWRKALWGPQRTEHLLRETLYLNNPLQLWWKTNKTSSSRIEGNPPKHQIILQSVREKTHNCIKYCRLNCYRFVVAIFV